MEQGPRDAYDRPIKVGIDVTHEQAPEMRGTVTQILAKTLTSGPATYLIVVSWPATDQYPTSRQTQLSPEHLLVA